MTTGEWFDWLENTILIAVGSFETPNEPKLSDGRGWRDRCVAGERRRLEAVVS